MGFDATQYKQAESKVYSMTAESYENYGGDIFRLYAEPLLKGSGLQPGDTVLDIACGPGIPSLMAAKLVAPGGTVSGIDLAPGMVQLAKRKARQAGLTNVTFGEGDAENIPFPDGSFDVVLCSHGLVHTTDRPKALGEMRRVLRQGGTIALSAWSTPEKSLTLSIVAGAIREHFPQAIVPGAPMWFDFGPEGALEKTLATVGFRDIKVDRYTVTQKMTDGEDYWQAVLGISGRLQMLLANIPDQVASRIKAHIVGTVERFRAGNQISIPCEEVLAWAIK